MALNTLESKIKYRISRSKDDVFVLKDFDDLSGRDQVSRVLRSLVEKECLAKISRGMYAKTFVSEYTGRVVLNNSLPVLAWDGLKKLGVKVRESQALKDYNSGKSTQVPTGRLIGVEGRVTRKIEYNGNEIEYEYGSR